MELKKEVENVLEETGFETVQYTGSFDFIAKKGTRLLFIKVLSNIDSLDPEQAKDLAELSNGLNAGVLVVGEKSTASKLYDGAVYERHDIPVVTLETLRDILEQRDPLIKAARGGFYVEIDGDKFQELRKQYGYSLGDMAREIGVSKPAVQKYETGHATTVKVAEQIEKTLGTTIINPIKIFEIKHEVIHRKADGFEGEVMQKLNILGFDVAFKKKTPFNIMANEEEEKILTGTHEEKLRQNADLLRRISQVLEAEPVFILKKCNRSEIEGVPVIDEKILKKINDLEEFLEKV